MQTILNEILQAVLRTPDSRQAGGPGLLPLPHCTSHLSCLGLPALTGKGVLHIEKSLQIALTIQGERGRWYKTSMIIVQQPIFNSFS